MTPEQHATLVKLIEALRGAEFNLGYVECEFNSDHAPAADVKAARANSDRERAAIEEFLSKIASPTSSSPRR